MASTLLSALYKVQGVVLDTAYHIMTQPARSMLSRLPSNQAAAQSLLASVNLSRHLLMQLGDIITQPISYSLSHNQPIVTQLQEQKKMQGFFLFSFAYATAAMFPGRADLVMAFSDAINSEAFQRDVAVMRMVQPRSMNMKARAWFQLGHKITEQRKWVNTLSFRGMSTHNEPQEASTKNWHVFLWWTQWTTVETGGLVY